MADSMNLISAQISFLEAHLALIHIPIELYSLSLQPILRLLFGEDHDEDAAKISWTNRHDFLNVSITTIECSIICSRYLADRFVRPVAEVLNRLYASNNNSSNKRGGGKTKGEIQIGAEDYIVIQVDGQGLDAGQRVLELTSPLAMAGISIFFITTYFSDYILVPFRSRGTVTRALQQRGFVFSKTADAFVSQLSPSSPTLPQGSSSGRPSATSSPFYDNSAPTTPPAKDIPELQLRTFKKLRLNNISPLVDGSIRLANCAGSREYDKASEERLKNDLLQVLLATAAPTSSASSRPQAPILPAGLGMGTPTSKGPPLPPPPTVTSELDFGAKFLSLTITSGEPISVLLEHRLLDRLGGSLLGAKSDDDALIPITLDLRELPLDATGIVCGVAGRLAQGSTDLVPVESESDDVFALGHGTTKVPGATTTVEPRENNDEPEPEPVEISFLSTARTGTVIVRAAQLEKALEALEYGMKRVGDAGGS
ncbi:uncharacterized protein Z519_00275 [Cladophialophora bantiana CBS 173.52]|uniref:CASTOR ACT domain-containing protein n=1 Tax=Cladophialophora bantiana (strain ATCC 10958 / CBS 173.52 / CDC B-1940 / NIH 8579) TaxID=1442370 RepID=A0A0D2IPC2_CLAB1|nr:uncharacterized protein Z519_00275 [Cladophialophora bantiana CBS 173.52]KIW98614.1 hypothetical protein Z519_00275 [Cladophialophora bantiana CBS 173.52]